MFSNLRTFKSHARWVQAACLLLSACFLIHPAAAAAAPPVVSNVVGVQRAGTKLVDITYDVADADSFSVSVTLQISSDAGATWTVPATAVTGQVGAAVAPGTARAIVWDAGTNWNNLLTTTMRYRITADDGGSAPSFALIPAGSFQMGDELAVSSNAPVHSVTVSAFYMQTTLLTKSQWDATYSYATSHGYAFDNAGAGKGTDHPVQTVSWYDVVKWCNARSEQDGLVPCYYSGAAIYKTGQVSTVTCDFTNNGYRLPTESEWEKAARGGIGGKRFPWGDTVTHSQANYYSSSSYSYDISPTRGYHPMYNTGSTPYTSPVGSFASNGYGLYDMAGNVWEWCWDLIGTYPSGTVSDPTGASTGSSRVIRGGSWYIYNSADQLRVAYRVSASPTSSGNNYGFRLARGSL